MTYEELSRRTVHPISRLEYCQTEQVNQTPAFWSPYTDDEGRREGGGGGREEGRENSMNYLIKIEGKTCLPNLNRQKSIRRWDTQTSRSPTHIQREIQYYLAAVWQTCNA